MRTATIVTIATIFHWHCKTSIWSGTNTARYSYKQCNDHLCMDMNVKCSEIKDTFLDQLKNVELLSGLEVIKLFYAQLN